MKFNKLKYMIGIIIALSACGCSTMSANPLAVVKNWEIVADTVKETDCSGSSANCLFEKRVSLAIQDPIIKSHFPRLRLESYSRNWNWGKDSFCGPGNRCHYVTQFASYYRLRQDNKVFGACVNDTFSNTVGRNEYIQTGDFVSDSDVPFINLLGDLVFTQDELIKLASSQVPEVRSGAAAHLKDAELLMKLLLEDGDDMVRGSADRNPCPLDPAALLKVVNESSDDKVRLRAIKKILKQDISVKSSTNTFASLPIGNPTSLDITGINWIVMFSDQNEAKEYVFQKYSFEQKGSKVSLNGFFDYEKVEGTVYDKGYMSGNGVRRGESWFDPFVWYLKLLDWDNWILRTKVTWVARKWEGTKPLDKNTNN